MFAIEKIKDQCVKSIDHFETNCPKENERASIVPSEAFSFCAMCSLYDVDLVIESGVKFGGSTSMISSYGDFEMISVDLKILPEVQERLGERVTLKRGNGIKLVRKLVKNNQDKRIGIFLDGPKGHPALNLAEDMLKYDCVKFVGTHDLYKSVPQYPHNGELISARERIEKSEIFAFCTDEDWFVEGCSKLDTDPEISQLIHLVEDLGSYSYTIGYLAK